MRPRCRGRRPAICGSSTTDGPKTRRSPAARAAELARRALLEAEDDPEVLAISAFVLSQVGEDIGAMLGLVDRALMLNPSYARGWFLSGVLRVHAGQPDLTIEHVETSLRLSPRERMGAPRSLLGRAYFFKR